MMVDLLYQLQHFLLKNKKLSDVLRIKYIKDYTIFNKLLLFNKNLFILLILLYGRLFKKRKNS